jgi:hypothetical protein
LHAEWCEFTENRAYGQGPLFAAAAGAVTGGNLHLVQCDFRYNFSFTAGAIAGSGRLENCRFIDNSGHRPPAMASTTYIEGSGLHFSQCLFTENNGTMLLSSGCTLSHCTVVGNTGGPGSIHCDGYLGADLSIIASNEGVAIHEGSPVLTCCDVFNNSGGDWVGSLLGQNGQNGNFSDWPRFCDPDRHHFTLSGDSPCLPGNHPHGYNCQEFIGAFGHGCGPVALIPQTWARIKAKYK